MESQTVNVCAASYFNMSIAYLASIANYNSILEGVGEAVLARAMGPGIQKGTHNYECVPLLATEIVFESGHP